MPRLHTKRNHTWGTGTEEVNNGKRVQRSLVRIARSDEWRKARNARKRARQS